VEESSIKEEARQLIWKNLPAELPKATPPVDFFVFRKSVVRSQQSLNGKGITSFTIQILDKSEIQKSKIKSKNHKSKFKIKGPGILS